MATEELRPLSSWWGGTSSPENKKQDERELQHNKLTALESEIMAMKKEHDDEISILRKIHAEEVATLKATIKTLETLLDQRAPATVSVIPPPLPYSLPLPISSPPSTVPVFITAAPPRQPSTPTNTTTNQNPNGSPLASFLTSLISTSNSSSSDPITEFLDKQRIQDIQTINQSLRALATDPAFQQDLHSPMTKIALAVWGGDTESYSKSDIAAAGNDPAVTRIFPRITQFASSCSGIGLVFVISHVGIPFSANLLLTGRTELSNTVIATSFGANFLTRNPELSGRSI